MEMLFAAVSLLLSQQLLKGYLNDVSLNIAFLAVHLNTSLHCGKIHPDNYNPV